MLDRQKVEAILTYRFPGVPASDLAAAVNAIMSLGDLKKAAEAQEHSETTANTQKGGLR